MDRKNETFKVVTFQYIEGSTVYDKLTVNAIFKPSKRFPFPYYRVPNAKGMVHFCGIVKDVQDKAITIFVDTISFLNQKARPSQKTLAAHAKLPLIPRRRHPSVSAQRCAKRRAQVNSMDAYFAKEKQYFDSDSDASFAD